MSIKWMVEERMEEHEEVKHEETMGDGRRRGVFQEGSGPDEEFDLGKHQGKTFKEVYLIDPGCCDRTVRQDQAPDV